MAQTPSVMILIRYRGRHALLHLVRSHYDATTTFSVITPTSYRPFILFKLHLFTYLRPSNWSIYLNEKREGVRLTALHSVALAPSHRQQGTKHWSILDISYSCYHLKTKWAKKKKQHYLSCMENIGNHRDARTSRDCSMLSSSILFCASFLLYQQRAVLTQDTSC